MVDFSYSISFCSVQGLVGSGSWWYVKDLCLAFHLLFLLLLLLYLFFFSSNEREVGNDVGFLCFWLIRCWVLQITGDQMQRWVTGIHERTVEWWVLWLPRWDGWARFVVLEVWVLDMMKWVCILCIFLCLGGDFGLWVSLVFLDL